MSKINVSVGTRELGPRAPVTYEIPRDVVAEAIVNAVAHRDYNGSVQVMLFTDRLEAWNPGTLPKALTLADLRRAHSSIPGNPLLAEPLYLTKYIERMGTGTRDMIKECVAAGLPEPEFSLTDSFVTTTRKPEVAKKPSVTPPVAPPVTAPVGEYVTRLLVLLADRGALSNAEILDAFFLKDRRRLRDTYIDPALADGLVERTIPEKPTSRLQKYRLTDKGRAVQEQLDKEGGHS